MDVWFILLINVGGLQIGRESPLGIQVTKKDNCR